MKKSFPSFLKPTIAAAVLSVASTGAYAAGAVSFNTTWNGGSNILNMTTTSLTQTNANSDNKSYTSNPNLNNAAWGHFGSWYTFHTHMAMDLLVTADAASGANAPGITVWRTDGQFDGGTGGTGELSSAGKGTPHSFNQVGAAGDYGTYWMTDTSIASGASANGIVQTMGYANDGVANLDNAWGAAIGNDGTADGHAEISLTSIAHGWYLVFVGGADGALTGGAIDLKVSAVPVPGAVYLFGSGLIGLFASSRRKLTTA